MKFNSFFLEMGPAIGAVFVNIPEPPEGGIDWQGLSFVAAMAIAIAIGFLIGCLRKPFWEKLKKFFVKKNSRK